MVCVGHGFIQFGSGQGKEATKQILQITYLFPHINAPVCQADCPPLFRSQALIPCKDISILSISTISYSLI